MFRVWFLVIGIAISFNVHGNSFENTNLSSGKLAYWTPPYVYEKNEIMFVDIRTESKILRALVPEPLKPNSENTIRLYLGKLNIVKPGESSYLEAGLVIPVSYYDEEYKYEKVGYYFPILYLNEVAPILGGREIYSFPKQDAEIEFTRDANFVHGIVKREGEIIIDVKLEITKKAELIAGEGPWEAFVYKRIPSADLENEYDVNQITSTDMKTDKINEQFFGEVTLNLGSTDYDPLDQIPVLEVFNGTFQIDNSTMSKGKVLHDYLSH